MIQFLRKFSQIVNFHDVVVEILVVLVDVVVVVSLIFVVLLVSFVFVVFLVVLHVVIGRFDFARVQTGILVVVVSDVLI